MKYKIIGSLLVIIGLSLALIDAHFIYEYYTEQGDSTPTLLPIITFVSIIPVVFGFKLLNRRRS